MFPSQKGDGQFVLTGTAGTAIQAGQQTAVQLLSISKHL